MTDSTHLRHHEASRADKAITVPRPMAIDEFGSPDGPAELRLLELQQSIGNRAVSEMLVVQRDAVSGTLMAGGDATPTSANAGGSALTQEQRVELRRLTGGRISRAFTAFVAACEQNRAAIKAAASDGGGFAELLLEIVLGRLLPGISKGISSLAQELPAAASSAGYRVALAAMDEARTTALLETAVKFGREAIGGGDVALEGEDEIDAFLNDLENQFLKGADAIDSNLPNLSDEALGVTCAAYDPSVTGIPQFRVAVRNLVQRYERQVKPIGTTEYHWMNRSSNFNLYWVVSPTGSKRLALLENDDLEEWIAPELQAIAIRKYQESAAGRLRNGQVPDIPASRVGGLMG